jgi:hypothetical protein
MTNAPLTWKRVVDCPSGDKHSGTFTSERANETDVKALRHFLQLSKLTLEKWLESVRPDNSTHNTCETVTGSEVWFLLDPDKERSRATFGYMGFAYVNTGVEEWDVRHFQLLPGFKKKRAEYIERAIAVLVATGQNVNVFIDCTDTKLWYDNGALLNALMGTGDYAVKTWLQNTRACMVLKPVHPWVLCQ